MDAERKQKKSAPNERSHQTGSGRDMASVPSSSSRVRVATKKIHNGDSSAASLLLATTGSSRSRLLSKVTGTYASMSPGKRLSRSYSFDYEDVSSRSAVSCSKLPASKADYDRGAEILASGGDNAATFDDVFGRYDDSVGSDGGQFDRHQMSYDELCQQKSFWEEADDTNNDNKGDDTSIASTEDG